MPKITPEELSAIIHGPDRKPTPEQSAVTSADPGSTLVVAGAGAGKTETMSARVLWLVANGLVAPDEVLGLTFTRKAAQELGRRIRGQFATLAASEAVMDLDPTGELRTMLENRPPVTATYDSFAGDIVKEFGLLVPVEPDNRLITQTELFSLAHRVVTDYTGQLPTSNSLNTVVDNLLELVENLNNTVTDLGDIGERSAALVEYADGLEKGKGQRGDGMTADLKKWRDTAELRIDYLPLVKALHEEMSRVKVATFNGRMAAAAGLARDHQVVGKTLRRRFRVVMLDEYQDTSYAQRLLLSNLFGAPGKDSATDPELTVTAVGDPMQSIYGWRGATVDNLEQFVTDFPAASGPAPKRQLTTSWRNPETVLNMANKVADGVFYADEDSHGVTRPVEELQAREGAGKGEISLGYYGTQAEEITAVADALATQYTQRREAGKAFTGAVLVRKNKDSAPIALALRERGVPVEIVGTGGLVDIPEVADLIALATILVRPGDDQSVLRILTGPLVGLGVADLAALGTRAKQLNRDSHERTTLPEDADPITRLKFELEQVTAEPPEARAGLGDALADLGEPEQYSPEGYRRLAALSAILRQLRTRSLNKGLVELFIDIDTACGIRTEVLSRSSLIAGGAAHLDRFLKAVEDFNGTSLPALLDYLELAREHEAGLEQGDVKVKGDRVQIMTVHKAKGLEWDCVAVIHADSKTYEGKTRTHLTNIGLLPTDNDAGEFAACEDRKELISVCKEMRENTKKQNLEEVARLFYVAVTRTERWLMVTGSGRYVPYAPFEVLGQAFPEHVIHWQAPECNPKAGEKTPEEPQVASFPIRHATPEALNGAVRVKEAMSAVPALQSGETYEFWENEVTALIEEHTASTSDVIDVELPGELTASDMVAMKKDPDHFARRRRRPVPFKPNQFAKRGTAFHEWLETRFGSQSLLDEDSLPGIDEQPVGENELDTLKEKFLASPFAERVPELVEHPFEITIGQVVVRGRMDAVFKDPQGGYVVVDWKTGHVPNTQDRASAVIQLAVYREALKRQLGGEHNIRAMFYYVQPGCALEPKELPTADELEELLRTDDPAIEY